MAVPKHRITRSRRGMRRAHSALALPTLSHDQTSGELTLRHHISEALYYRGKPVLAKLREARVERQKRRADRRENSA